jgi:hypothetical protein
MFGKLPSQTHDMVAWAHPFIFVVAHVQGRRHSVLIHLLNYVRRSVLRYLYTNGIV